MIIFRYDMICGFLLGIFLFSSIFNNLFLILCLVFIVLTGNWRLKREFLLPSLGLLILALAISAKQILIPDFSPNFVVDLFQLFLILVILGTSVNKNYLMGVLAALSPVFTLDIFVNLAAAVFNLDLGFGSIGNERVDGSRYGGLFGNSFYSLALAFAFVILLHKCDFKRIAPVLEFSLLISGALRGIIIFCLLQVSRFFRTESVFAYLSIACAISLIFLITVLSVSNNYFGVGSGNFFRVYAWSMGINDIQENFLTGLGKAVPAVPSKVAINFHNIEFYKFYESRVISDLAKYGIVFFILKLMIFFEIVRVGLKRIRESKEIPKIHRVDIFLVYYLLIDYFLFSLLGMPILAFIFFLSMCSNNCTKKSPQLGSG